MKHVKMLIVLWGLLCLCLSAQEERVNKIELLSYLKSHYLGKHAKRIGVPRSSSAYYYKVKNVLEKDDGFFVVFTNKEQAKIYFHTTLKKRSISEQRKKNKRQQQLLQLQTLQTQEKLNFNIKNTLSDADASGGGSSSLQHLEKNMDAYFSKNYFTTTKKITYTNSRTSAEESDYFIVFTDGLYLNSGVKLTSFVRPLNDRKTR